MENNQSSVTEMVIALVFLIACIMGAYYVGKWGSSSDCMDRAYSSSLPKEQAVTVCKGGN